MHAVTKNDFTQNTKGSFAINNLIKPLDLSALAESIETSACRNTSVHITSYLTFSEFLSRIREPPWQLLLVVLVEANVRHLARLRTPWTCLARIFRCLSQLAWLSLCIEHKWIKQNASQRSKPPKSWGTRYLVWRIDKHPTYEWSIWGSVCD